jgi:anaerobic dimethyl sulfoxide reductase subunit A
MAGLLEKIEGSTIDRRKFIGLAATAGVVASLGLTGCDNKLKPTGEVGTAPTLAKLEGGEWIPFNCMTTGSCGMRCFNQAYVADGIILRQATETTPDSEDNPQHRGCPKGRSVRKILTAAERLKYPMKRKNWQPGGGDNIHGELRGIDEWERISWDDAITYIANEFIRIRDTYGNRAFLALGSQHFSIRSGRCGSAALNLIGGCLTTWGQASQGGFPVVSNMMRGQYTQGCSDSQDRMALRHTKLIVLWGYNPAWCTSGGNMYHFINAKRKSGAKVIVVDPYFNASAQALADQWIPCRPGTDGALLEALAYEIIENNWQDQEYLDKCCVGFDAEHMPADAQTTENFKDYILGAYDGQPKTPEWASKICGTSADIIKDFAKQIATTKPTAFKTSAAPARTYYGNRYAQLFFTVGWMTGNEGILGGEVSAGSSIPRSQFGAAGGVPFVRYGASNFVVPKNAICTEPRGDGKLQSGIYDPNQEYGIAFAEVFKAVVTGKYRLPGPTGETRDVDIKCMYRENCWQPANQLSGGDWIEEAFRKVEFVAIQDNFLVVDAQYADIVLPVITPLEAEYSTSFDNTPVDFLILGRQIIKPYYESLPDSEVYYRLAQKMGFGEDIVPHLSEKQAAFNQLFNANVIKEDGKEREPLVTVTAADLEYFGIEGEPQDGRVPIREFVEKGSYQVIRSDGDNLMNIYNKSFREDPDANPLKTTSGKNEIISQKLKDYYDLACFNDLDLVPKYKAAVDGYEQSLEDKEFPFQLVTPHHIRQAHTTYANVKQLNEVFPNDLIMNPLDAEKNGFQKGDWVVASCKEGGKIARRLNITPFVMPGVVLLGQGNWRQLDPETGIDIGANVNTVTRPAYNGDGYQPFNTVLLKIEPYTGKELLPDYKRAPIVPALAE